MVNITKEKLEIDLNDTNETIDELEDKASELEKIVDYFKELWKKFIEFLQNNSSQMINMMKSLMIYMIKIYLMKMILMLYKTILKVKMILIEIYSKSYLNTKKFVIILMKWG